ncbi:LysR family transcriptional regulator, cys regulon transcriptional activator [Novimethylophilus kurashikiensis]|uniref:LysR family transcriptional regulator, cys regulon transcriptional activator n=1 Tax=Novimethylophilus kurashikiensis TaxID=1825523 RepID=A0A2R5F353_9PROT|nr:HTH-type transcriptional regulator CysB [Novimethylophilus kurashikiensis]GBG12795.1 LysR family transcriptional regulator, cys regulon transcriptional activator [Novimethylophilus kurashikiensis]
MKLHQLRYIREVHRQGLNVSTAADVLHTSQPGVSKQIQLLEEELGLQIFHRSGKRLTSVTEPGMAILNMAERVLREMENIKRVGEDFTQESEGCLSIATTHTQARYRLPPAVKAFVERYPSVQLSIHQGSPKQVSELVINGEADIGIATESIAENDELAALPCYTWNRCVVVPPGHPLADGGTLTLERIAQYPIVTYDLGFTGSTSVKRMFEAQGLNPNIVLTAIDSDVIKTYVELGLGVGLLAKMAYNQERDQNLVMLDASHLFPDSTTYLGVRRDAYLRGYIYEFIHLIAPHLDRQAVNAAL